MSIETNRIVGAGPKENRKPMDFYPTPPEHFERNIQSARNARRGNTATRGRSTRRDKYWPKSSE